MPKLVCAVLVSLLLIGCEDPNARKHAEASVQFDQAVDVFNKADVGYAPRGEDSYSTYRQELLEKAGSQLKAVARAEGATDKQQSAAQQMLGAVYTSQARYLARQAAGEAAKVAEMAVVLPNQLAIIDQNQNRLQSYDRDEQELIDTLRANRVATHDSLPGIEKQIRELKQKISGLEKAIAEHQAAKDEYRAEKSRYEDKAFIVKGKGDEYYDLMDKATEADRMASTESAAADSLMVELDVVESDLKLVEQKLAIAKEDITQFDEQIAEAMQRNELYQQEKQAAMEERAKSIGQMQVEYDAVIEAFNADVLPLFEQAVEKATQAVDATNQAVRKAGRDSSAVKIDRLSAKTLQAYIMTQHAVAMRNLLDMQVAIANHADRLLNGLGDKIGADVNSNTEKVQTLTTEATTAIDEAQMDVKDLGGGDENDPDTKVVNKSKQSLESFRNQLGVQAPVEQDTESAE